MKLFDISYPENDFNRKKHLYFKNLGDKVSYASYFNSFAAGIYNKYTKISEVSLNLTTKCSCRVLLVKASLLKNKIIETIIEEKECNPGQELIFTCNIEGFEEESILYPEFYKKDDSFRKNEITSDFCQGYWFCRDEYKSTDVKMAAVITTYRRESFIISNLKELACTEKVKDGSLKVFVIDNGQTLDLRQQDFPFAKIFPNKNLGGAGGFTRGIMEVLKNRENFSHIILMDDDIAFNRGLFTRNHSFLSVLKDEYKTWALGGAMLRLNDPCIQHERGSCYDFLRLKAWGKNANLCKQTVLMKNLKAVRMDFNAWWYCCYPVECIDKDQLPMPYFIKGDDIEFGIRKFKNKFIMVNGISVWHQEFAGKDSPYLYYYSIRNRLTSNAIHEEKCLAFKTFLTYAVHLTFNTLKRKKAVYFVKLAFRDFLKGAEHLNNIDGEELNGFLRSHKSKCCCDLFYIVRLPFEIIKAVFKIALNQKQIKSYKEKQADLVSWQSWAKRLGI
ncbi:glycosyltransferase [Treponema sp.]|uniref:glycosyltransferase n=1 Tax=Treponema sp. TaxID=166 RepID=UPI0025FB87A5|nr:glycosyltransferase [Treponema sp.]MCR5217747.1 glycosyltransferase [Treponema sp.]